LTTWRRANERARLRVWGVPVRRRDRGGARVPVRPRGGSDPHEAVPQAARIARPRHRYRGGIRRAGRDSARGPSGAVGPGGARASPHGGEGEAPPPRGAPRRPGGGRAGRVRPEGGWHRSVVGVVRRTLEAAYDDNIPFLASALSFDLLLTVIPFVALLLAVVGSLVQHQVTTQQVDLHELLARLLPTTPGGGTDRAFQAVESALS